MSILSIIGTIPALLMITKLRGEETKNRKEPLLARAVSRINLMGGYLALALVSGAIMLALSGMGMWSAAVTAMEDPLSFNTILHAIMVYYPAVLVMIGVAVLLMGFKPQGLSLAWLYLGYSFFVVYLGELLDIPGWMAALSPFGHIPQFPVEEINYTALGLLTAISIILMVAGLTGYRNRDIEG